LDDIRLIGYVLGLRRTEFLDRPPGQRMMTMWFSQRAVVGTSSWKRCLTLALVLLYITPYTTLPAVNALTVAADDALRLQCPPCERVHCSPRRPSRLRCRGGVVRGVCNCCPVCAKLDGDPCGGRWNYLGTCDVGLYCDTSPLTAPSLTHRSKITADTGQSSRTDYKHQDLNWLSKTEGYCRKGTGTIVFCYSFIIRRNRSCMQSKCISPVPMHFACSYTFLRCVVCRSVCRLSSVSYLFALAICFYSVIS